MHGQADLLSVVSFTFSRISDIEPCNTLSSTHGILFCPIFYAIQMGHASSDLEQRKQGIALDDICLFGGLLPSNTTH
jgi:hypothetical protein